MIKPPSPCVDNGVGVFLSKQKKLDSFTSNSIQSRNLAEGKGKAARTCLEEAGAQRCEATDRNCIEGRGYRGELAQDSKAHRYGAYGKCSACARKHRVLTWGDLTGVRCAVEPQIQNGSLEPNDPGVAAGCRPRTSEHGSERSNGHSAARRNVRRDGSGVSRGHSVR